MASQPWSNERVEQLRALWPTGKSCSVIAAEMGGGLTRNAVIGKATRLKLQRRNPGNPLGHNRQGTAQERRNARKRELRREVGKPEWPVLRRVAHTATQPLPGAFVSLQLPIAAWTPFSCRWIEGDDHLACGHIGYPWCAHHARLAHQPLSKSAPVKRGWGETGVHFKAHV